MKKLFVILGILVAVLVLMAAVLVGGYFYLFGASDNTVTAELVVAQGEVFVNSELILDTVLLSVGDVITTSETGKAKLVLYESVFMDLGENSNAVVYSLDEKNPIIEQTLGSSWVNFAKSTSVESLEIRNDNMSIIVNGTTSFTEFSDDAIVSYVITGSVMVTTDTFIILLDSRYMDKLIFNTQTGDHVMDYLDSVDLEYIMNNVIRIKGDLIEKRQKLMDEHPDLFRVAEVTTGLSSEQLLLELDLIDNGTTQNLNSIVNQLPMRNSAINKFIGYTREIIKLNEYIKKDPKPETSYYYY